MYFLGDSVIQICSELLIDGMFSSWFFCQCTTFENNREGATMFAPPPGRSRFAGMVVELELQRNIDKATVWTVYTQL